MRTLWKHKQSALKKSLPKGPRARLDVVGSSKAVRLPPSRQRKAPQTRRDVVGSARVVRQRQMKVL
jgi:hypothetical protein